MRPIDFLEPLTLHHPKVLLRDALPTLRAGVAAAITEGDGWRVLRPRDVVAFPPTRQLRDLPSIELPTLGLDDEIELDRLIEHDVWGATRDGRLVGKIDSLRVVGSVPPGALVTGPEQSPRQELFLAELLHDVANALTVASAIEQRPDPSPGDRRALREALRHATSLVTHSRWVCAENVCGERESIDLRELLGAIEPVLQVAARPARVAVRCVAGAAIDGQRWRLESALLNLALNAAGQGCDQIRVSVTGDPLELSVEDDGPGFAGGEPGCGGGLHGHGLRSVRRQVAALGGEVAIDRSPELGGARVRIRF